MHMPMSTMMPNMDMMKMYFHVGYQPHILIEQWAAKSDGGNFYQFFLNHLF